MKNRKATIFMLFAMMAGLITVSADKVVILHTNDTHSSIEPNAKGVGGALQRKAVVDSVRKARKNVLLVDAGDVVQGTLYFNFFRGDVEYPLMNMFDYDVRMLGNHEFDNGLQELADHWKDVKGARLSANYDFSNTPLKGMFDPYVIKKIGGKKIGFFGINIDPANLIAKENYEGMGYKDAIATANATAEMLKKEKKCDLVVAVTHIGYVKTNDKATDVDLAKASKDIDIIIGGHSHTTIFPDGEKYPDRVKNLEGRDVLITQTGKYGGYIGQIEIDTDRLGDGAEAFTYSLIPVTDRFPAEKLDKRMSDFIKPYKHKVDSVNSHVIARSLYALNGDDRTGGYPNWIADFARNYGEFKADSLAIDGLPLIGLMNVGGIRQSMPQGDVTEGLILSTFPFANKMTLVKVKGSDLIKDMGMALSKGGEAVSDNVRVVYGIGDGGEKVLRRVVVDGREVEPDENYLVSTIDYVAGGNDDFTGIANGEVLWTDGVDVKAPLMKYILNLTNLGLAIAPDPNPRFVQEIYVTP